MSLSKILALITNVTPMNRCLVFVQNSNSPELGLVKQNLKLFRVRVRKAVVNKADHKLFSGRIRDSKVTKVPYCEV